MFELGYFERSLRGIGANQSTETFELLASLYSQPNRHYHNQNHISQCLFHFQKYRHQANFPDEIEIAIWFHDAIYDTTATNNEEKSAELAENRLNLLNAKPKAIKRIVEMILATKNHQVSSIDSKLMIDIDLLILGSSPSIFEEYDRKIRKEYDWVAQKVYLQKRIQILKSFLSRDFIFHTKEIREQYDQQARNNLSRKIAHLQNHY